MKFGLTCEEVVARLTELEEGALPILEAARVRFHLSRCEACQAVRDGLDLFPRLLRADFAREAEESAEPARLAFQAAMARLGQPRPPRALPSFPVPDTLRAQLTGNPDLPLRLLAQTHRAFGDGRVKTASPYLPEEVLAQVPPPERWQWRRHGRLRAALLAEDPATGARLSLVEAMPGFRAPRHEHVGSESILVLDGTMEEPDGSDTYLTGKWVHKPEGSSHAPVVLGPSCWCLIREEGRSRYTGPLGWIRNLLAA